MPLTCTVPHFDREREIGALRMKVAMPCIVWRTFNPPTAALSDWPIEVQKIFAVVVAIRSPFALQICNAIGT
jgi:hypothetical protein